MIFSNINSGKNCFKNLNKLCCIFFLFALALIFLLNLLLNRAVKLYGISNLVF